MAQSPLPLISRKTRRATRTKSGTTRRARPLSPKNRQALKLLQAWMSAPDDKSADWWNDFEHELAKHRPSFRIT